MDEHDNQIHVPPSFMAVYSDARNRLTEKPAVVRTRYELCEDLASHLVEHAQTLYHVQAPSEAEGCWPAGASGRISSAAPRPAAARAWSASRSAAAGCAARASFMPCPRFAPCPLHAPLCTPYAPFCGYAWTNCHRHEKAVPCDRLISAVVKW